MHSGSIKGTKPIAALWDDEVICGFGRLGKDFGANAMDMKPDMMVFAKALSSAYVPVSAAVISGEFAEAIEGAASDMGVFGHGYTYSGHPLGCAVAHKVLEFYERDRIFEHAETVGAYLQSRLQEYASHPLVGEVSGMGMIGALELVANRADKTPFEGMVRCRCPGWSRHPPRLLRLLPHSYRGRRHQ